MSEQIKGFSTQDIRLLLDPLNSPNVKQYFVYDADGNPVDIYYAQANTASGEKCLHQQLEYATVSGNTNVKKIAWVDGLWGGNAWDI